MLLSILSFSGCVQERIQIFEDLGLNPQLLMNHVALEKLVNLSELWK